MKCPVSDLRTGFDPLDLAQQEDRYQLWAYAREQEPVFYSEPFDVWFITRWADVEAAQKDHAHFSTEPVFFPSKPWPQPVREVLDRGYSWHYFLSNNDPPEHTPLKKAVSKAFTRTQTRSLEARIEEIAAELVDSFAASGRVDVGAALAYSFPAYVVLEIIGFPREDMERLKGWGDDWLTLFSDSADVETLVTAAEGFVSFQNYVLDHLRERQREPREDLLSHLLEELHRDPAVNLGLEDIVNVPINIMSAGHETGTLLMLGILSQLLADRELLARVEDHRELIPDLVEEALRYEPPVHGIFRVTKASVEVAGTTIPAGARVLLCYGSANHDPEVFAEPERFDPDRADVGNHFGFGKGTHFCPGAPIARLEQRVALEALFDRCPNLRLADDQEPRRFIHFWLRGYRELWLEWDPDAAALPPAGGGGR
ncbi:MAG: cytochrome P450 [Actinobacteria bacterium]|nr:cytochrome P450 [Actinomycetota bacterium]